MHFGTRIIRPCLSPCNLQGFVEGCPCLLHWGQVWPPDLLSPVQGSVMDGVCGGSSRGQGVSAPAPGTSMSQGKTSPSAWISAWKTWEQGHVEWKKRAVVIVNHLKSAGWPRRGSRWRLTAPCNLLYLLVSKRPEVRERVYLTHPESLVPRAPPSTGTPHLVSFNECVDVDLGLS